MLIDISIKKYNSANKLAGMRKVAATVTLDSQNGNNFGMSLTKGEGFYSATDGSILYCDENKNWSLAAKSDGTITSRSVPFPALEQGASYAVKTAGPSAKAQARFVELRNKAKKEQVNPKEQEISTKIVNTYWSIKKQLEENYFGKPNMTADSSKKIIYRFLREENFADGLSAEDKYIYNNSKSLKYLTSTYLKTLSDQVDQYYGSGKKPASGGSGSQATRGGSGPTGGDILIAETHRGLSGLVDTGNRDYVYTTSPDGASASYTYRGDQGKTLDKNYPRWVEFVGKLNALPIGSATRAAPSATPAATTAPTEAAPATTTSDAEVAPAVAPADNLTINVARLLSNVDAGHTYAGKTVFTNERGMVRRMLAAIGKIYDNYESKGITVTGDAPLALAKMIVGMKRSTLERSSLASFDSGQLSSMGEKEIEKTFRGDLDIIMRAVVDIDSRLGGKAGYGKLENYLGIKGGTRKQVGGVSPTNAPVTPGTLTPAPTSPALPELKLPQGSSPYSFEGVSPSLTRPASFDPRIKKLAKLRRLEVRAQMEAAVEPSAKLGRSRIS